MFTPAQMREMDRATIEDIGVPGPVLMERAALGVSTLVRARFPGRHTLVVCGRGNNGGDGLAAARQLHLAGHPVACIVAAASPADLSPDAALNYRRGREGRRQPAHRRRPRLPVGRDRAGGGLPAGHRSRRASSRAGWRSGRALINAAGARGVPVLAVDVPSGVDAATGAMAAGCVAADLTITFHARQDRPGVPAGL